MRKRLIAFVILLVLLLFLLPSLKNLPTFFDKDEERIYTVLTLYDSEEGEKLGFLFFYWYPKTYMLLFDINKDTIVMENGRVTPIMSGSKREIKQRIEEIYGYTIDYIATPSQKQRDNIIDIIGGEAVFNLYSPTFAKGELFLDRVNYRTYLKSIEDDLRRSDAEKSFWYNLLENHRKQMIIFKDRSGTLKDIYKNLAINSTFVNFSRLLEPLLKKESEIFFYSLRNNLERLPIEKKVHLTPYQKGRYDHDRIKDILLTFKSDEPKFSRFPITLQVRNTTDIGRLAARTAGVLRIKRIDVLEYRNSPVKTKESVLLDYSLSPVKREYMKKATHIQRVYPAFDYQKSFDFSLYIAPDYYAIDLFEEKKR